MSLRRLAQANAAIASPSRPDSHLTASTSSPLTSGAPSTPRNRVSIGAYRSPASTPSISSSIPFDWNAARSRKPPPYGTPLQTKARKSLGVGSTTGTPAKRVVRKKGIFERITSIPSAIAFEIALFPHNVPLPSPRTSGRLLGGTLHLLHLCVRISQIRKVPDSDLGWEDMYREGEGTSWFDWTTPVSIFLIAAACLNAVYLFTRIKLYRLHHRPDPVSSPNARFVSAQLDFAPLEAPSLIWRLTSGMWYAFSYSWRWLLGMKPPTRPGQLPGRTARVQQLEVWAPGELEKVLFAVYSPAHALLWTATGSSNWISMLVVMGLVGAQLHAMTYSYTTLLKDKDIIAAEVMSEYNEGVSGACHGDQDDTDRLQFVYPRINPIRKDVAVMTHESEIVNVWEEDERDSGWDERPFKAYRNRDRSYSPPPRHSRSRIPPRTSTSSFVAPPPASPPSLPPPSRSAPPPPMPASVPPPSLMPVAPKLVSNVQITPPEQLKATWAERIKLIADSVTCKQQMTKLETDITNTQRLLDSARVSDLPDESKQRIQTELSDLQAKQKDLAKRRDDTITQLTKSNAWPAPPLTDAEEKELKDHNDMVAYVETLEKTAKEMNALLNDLRERKGLDDTLPTPMDVDQPQDGSSRPPKRRRVSDDPEPAPVPERGPTLEELEEVHDKLQDLEARYVTFENDQYAHDAEMRAEAEEALDAKLEEFRLSLAEAPVPGPDDKYAVVKNTVDEIGSEVQGLTTEVASLVEQAEAQKKEMEAVRQRIEDTNAELAQMTQQFQTLVAERERDHRAIAALEAALTAYTTEPPPVSPYPGLTHDQLIELMEEPLLDMVRDNVKPLIELLRVQVETMLRSQNQEMYKTLWGRLSLTLRMVEAIAKRIEEADAQAAAAAMAAGTAAAPTPSLLGPLQLGLQYATGSQDGHHGPAADANVSQD
ncbi:hypothetical protein DXG03_001836 [Asterophora parasitica]|uniref:Uncharacterized protein n=1 Tax=Asterophora parasitica TaxID=117018 RepID=A0A9P7G922_9AGAR|nr:hypothetical protein DXG03_001836 [Asterophora parasitica]